MFRFISAWLQAVLRYIAVWLQAAAAAAADDSDAAVASPQAAMDFPVTASLGPLHRPLHSFKATKNNLPDGVSDGQVRRLEEDLETLFTELKIVSEADDPSFTARCWMKEVRELRYDAEDFFSEVLRSSANGGEGATRRGALLWIPSKLKRQRQVAEAFSDLWARAKDASRRRQSFQLGPATIRDEFGQDNVSSRSKSPQLVDLEESMDRLVKVLAFDSEDADQQLQVVPIFGFAGVGKTTLARTFYRNFHGKFQCQAFVRVSRNSDMRMLLSSILSQIKAPPVHAFPDVQDLIDYIREYLQRKRYLIVIDDLWTSSTWDIIRRAFPDGDCCCRIIVTTEIEDVALTCSRYQFKYMYEMSPLNGDQSRQLFLIKVFGSENVCPSDFKEVAYEIIWKCGGLPLAIENIASMLACELKVDQWKHIRDSLPSVLGLRTDPSSEGLKEVLNIIYDNLSPYLKTCLLYLIMYPEGNTISKEDLVKQWVAEDFIGEGQNREQTARDYFDELVSRGMIEPVDINYNDEVLTCTVHHLVLDLITYKSLEENFIINVSYFQTTPGLPDKVRRLSVQFGGAKCASIPADFMMTQVKSLVYFGFYNCVPSVVEYKLLRVLILHIWADESKIFDLTGISELLQLRYLKIDCNITIHLPDEIRQLKFLETLELHAPVNDMPSDISFLPLLSTLGYFDLSKNSVENVQSLGELKNLQDLHLTRSNTEEPDNLKNNMQCLGSILWKLINLKSLTLVPAASSHADVLDDAGAASVGISGDVLSNVSSPPALLQRLELSGRCCIFASLPEWTKELGNLCILKISVRRLLRKDIDILKGMPALMSLSLYVWTVPVGKVVFDNEGFSVLKYFKFTCAAPCVAFLKGALPSVRVLKLAFNANRMEQYGQIVAGLEYLVELREITAKVGGTDADESDKKCAESALSCAIANHPRTPIIRVECVDRIFDAEEDTSVTQEQEHWTLEKQQEIQEELLDALPRLLIPTPSTQTQMRDGGKNEGTDGSVEVLIQEQEHWTLEKQLGIQEEFLDPVPELLSTPSRRTQTRDGVHGEKIERSMEILTHEHLILEKQHEIQEELRYSLPKFPSTPSTQTQARDELQAGEIERLMEVWTQEQEQSTLKKQQEMTDRAEDVQIGKSMEVVAQEENSTLQKQHEVKRELHNPLPELLSIPSTIASYHSTVDSRLSALFAEDAHLVGIDGPRDDLAKWMVEAGNSSAKHHCRVLAIVGFGGLGKTTLANQIYRKTKGHFHCQAFVLASQKPDIKKIIMDLISQVSSHGFTEDIDNWDEERSIAELRELLQDKRYLVVIDDIWSTKAWDIIKCAFPENNYSSRIITTTRSIDVARSCCMGQEDSIYNIQPLSDFHSKKLFFNRIFGYGDGPDMLEDVSNEILEKCGGIPLAIISISSLLANRPVNKEEWEKVRRSIGCAVEKNGSLEGMKSILQLSYNDLSANLKACLVHVAFFSENSVLEREKLVSLWVARGFIYEKSGKNLEEVGEDYFYELINRSIIQAVDICYDGKARACRVHDMVLDLVISKLAEEVTVIGNAQTGSSPWTSDLNLASVLINEEISNVRLLMVTSSSFTEHFPSLAWFGNLCALDLEGCDRLESYNMKGVGMLFQLKYLSLRGTWISHLPPEVVMLHSLEVLDIRDTHIEELSAGIVHLTELRYLIASDYGKAGIKITNAIRNMKNLRVLFCYGINSGSLGALEKLGNLNNLNLKHGKIGSKYTWHSHVELSLHKLGRCKQQSLTIRRMFPNLAKPLGTWSPLLFCHQRFEISGRYNLRCIPERIPPAPNHLTINNHLTYLEINIVEVMEKDLHILGEIPALLHLELTCQTVRKERLTFHGRGFKRLKEFVYDAAVLPSGNLLFTEGALPMLEDLSLIYCVSMVKSYGFFLGIEHLPRLKNAQVRLYKEGATSSDISSAEVAIMNEADAHPNLPRVTMVEHVKREGYCCGECSNTTVTDLL